MRFPQGYLNSSCFEWLMVRVTTSPLPQCILKLECVKQGSNGWLCQCKMTHFKFIISPSLGSEYRSNVLRSTCRFIFFHGESNRKVKFFIPSAKASPSGKVNAGLIPTVINPPKSPEITFSITGFTSFPFSERVRRGCRHNNTSKCLADGKHKCELPCLVYQKQQPPCLL